MANHTFNSYGQLRSAPDEKIINKIYAYIESVLLNFEFSTTDNENSITNNLSIVLNELKPAEYPFFFHHQNLEDKRCNTSTDMAVIATQAYAQYNSSSARSYLLKIEAKRLNNTLPKKRENEYVIGEYLHDGQCSNNSGGIERFKNGRHGLNVNHACLLGYVQTDTHAYWLEKINTIINKQIQTSNNILLTWSFTDLLQFKHNNQNLSIYNSQSSRISNKDIYLRHIWINASY